MAPPTILHLEDSALDADLICNRLRKAGLADRLEHVASRDAYLARLDDESPIDLILSDYQIPGFDGLEALELALETRPGVPFVFVSGAIGEDVAVEMLKRGATDYVLKQRLDRLGAAVERALAESRERKERLRAVVALRDSEARLRLAFTAVRMIAWEMIPTPRRIVFNGDLAEVFGLPAGNGLQEQAQRLDLLHPDDRDAHVALVERTLKRGGSYVDLFRIVRPDDGSVQWMEERAHAISGADGKTERLVGVMFDVTERVRAESEVRRLKDELEAKVVERTTELLAANEQLQGFTYSVAHDLRQQIRGISTNASIVLEDAPEGLDEESRASLERLVRSARQLSALVDDLLGYARLGRQQPNLQAVELSAMAAGIATQLATEEYAGRPTIVEIEPGLTVRGDASMLGLVLQNLLDNAFKYAAYESDPSVRVGRREEAIFVADNGVGFDMTFAHKIFEPFERLHGGSLFKGTGVGLANVKRIVEKHGGRVWAESEPGKGSTFYFTLG